MELSYKELIEIITRKTSTEDPVIWHKYHFIIIIIIQEQSFFFAKKGSFESPNLTGF